MRRARKACWSASRPARRWPAIAQKLPELGDRPRVLGFNYDTGERYLSVPDFLPEQGLSGPLTPFVWPAR